MAYEYKKTKREICEEEITKSEGMSILDYFAFLSEEAKL